MIARYCNQCGAPLAKTTVQGDTQMRLTCTSCQAVCYENPKTIVATVVTHRQTILVCKRAVPPAMDQWVLPSGFLENGETLQQGAARETLEETGIGLDCSALQLYSIVSMPHLAQITVAFRTDLQMPMEPAPGPECSTARFMPIRQLKREDFAWSQSMGDSVDILFQEIESGEFNIHLVTLGSADGSGYESRHYRVN